MADVQVIAQISSYIAGNREGGQGNKHSSRRVVEKVSTNEI